MGARYEKENLINGRLYLCVECSKCKEILPLALAIDDRLTTVCDKGIGLESTCYDCNHSQNYQVEHAHLYRAKDNQLKFQSFIRVAIA